MIWILKAEYVADYKIHVTFNNDESGIIDLNLNPYRSQEKKAQPSVL